MTQNTWTMTLSQEMAKRAQALKRDDQTPNEVMEQIFKLGLYQLEYRREKNPKRAEEQKNMRRVYKLAQTNPELAVKLGLGTRPTL